MSKRGIAVLLVISSLPLWSVAQSFYSFGKERTLMVTGGFGTSSYFGDIKDDGDYLDAKPSFSVGLQMFFHHNIMIRSELGYFTLRGNDAESKDDERRERNLSFTSGNFEFNTIAAYNIFPLGRRFYQRPIFNFYGFTGIGLMYMNPKAEYQGKKYALQPLQTEDEKYARVQPVIPYGLGARLRVNPFFNIAVEGAWRLTFTDYMDDVSTVHPDKSGWTDPIRVALSDRRTEGNPNLPSYTPGTQRGDPNDNDAYFLLSLKIEYYLRENFLFRDYYRKLYTIRRKAYQR